MKRTLRGVDVKIKMPKDMYDDFVETWEWYKEYYKGTTLVRENKRASGSFEEFLSEMIIDTLRDNFVFVVKNKKNEKKIG